MRTFTLALTSLITTATLAVAEKPVPNIVIINVDDLGWADINYMPEQKKRYPTPNIEALAKESMVFTNGYAACPVCSPTRASLVTGKTTASLKLTAHIAGNPAHVARKTPKNAKLLPAVSLEALPLEEVTFAEILKTEGYKTGFIGKWHLAGQGSQMKLQLKGAVAPEFHPEHQGFDVNIGGCAYGSPKGSYFDPYHNATINDRKKGEYLTDRLADEALNFITENKEQKFILYLNPYTVHTPIQAPKARSQKVRELGYKGKNATYAAMVYSLDLMVGRITDHLRTIGLEKNTVLILTSDNGGLFGNGPLRDKKGTLYEGGIRVPYIIRWPKHIQAGSVSHEPIISYDLFPTLLSLAGCSEKNPTDIEGQDISPILFKSKAFKRQSPLLWHYPHYHHGGDNSLDMGTAIRDGDWKFIHIYKTGKNYLFNLKNDPSEKQNLAQRNPEKCQELHKKLKAHLKQVDAQMPIDAAASTP